MNRNHWFTFPYDCLVAEWYARFPPPLGRSPEPLMRFACLLVDAGKHHAVWDTPKFSAGVGSGSTTYETRVREALDERQHLSLALLDLDPAAPSTARLAFYRHNEIVEEDVGDVGALLKTVCPGLRPRITASAPPLKVLGFSVPTTHAEEVMFRIRLDTDIWFPRVVGMGRGLSDDDDDDPDVEDNVELAARHTPRLNAFLGELRTATESSGGHWEIDRGSDFGTFYNDQWDENGIAI